MVLQHHCATKREKKKERKKENDTAEEKKGTSTLNPKSIQSDRSDCSYFILSNIHKMYAICCYTLGL